MPIIIYISEIYLYIFICTIDYLLFHSLNRHSELSLNGTCGYEGGLDKNHDPELFNESEMSKLGRVCSKYMTCFL
jgi:hypothetical protein